jgi:tetratricopeptide (TPR) repeat protein
MSHSASLLHLQILFSLIILLQALAGWLPGPLLWGLNHLAYAPTWTRIIWPLLGFLMIWTPLHIWLGRALVHSLAPRLLERNVLTYLVAPILGGVILWFARCRTHFLGDGWLLAALVAKGQPFHGYDFIDYFLHSKLFAWLGLQTEAQALSLYAVVSVAAGVLYLALVSWSAKRLARDQSQRVLLCLLLLFCAPLQLFMGYVESYALLAVCMLLFCVTLVLHYRQGLSVIFPAGAMGAGLLLHANALFLAPLLALTILCPAPRQRPTPLVRRILITGLPAVAGLLLGIALLLLAGYDQTWFRHEFGEGNQLRDLFVGFTGSHGLLSWVHWKDVLNLHLLLVPLPLILLASAGFRHRLHGNPSGRQPTHSNSRDRAVFLAGCAWLALLTSVVHMRLGIARDWDLFAAHAPVFVLAAWLAWSEAAPKRNGTHLVGLVAGVGFIVVLPWFLLNAGEERSTQRFRDVIADQSPYARAYAHEEMGRYFRNRGMFSEALLEFRTCIDISPGNARLYDCLGELQYRLGDKSASLGTYLALMTVDPNYAPGLATLARIYDEHGQTQEALEYARRLAGQPKEGFAAAALHGSMAERLDLPSEAIQAYARALAMNPQRCDLAERLVTLMISARGSGFTENAFRETARGHPNLHLARTCLALALWLPARDEDAARLNPETHRRLVEALQLMDGLLADQEACEQLSIWREEIRAALHRR